LYINGQEEQYMRTLTNLIHNKLVSKSVSSWWQWYV